MSSPLAHRRQGDGALPSNYHGNGGPAYAGPRSGSPIEFRRARTCPWRRRIFPWSWPRSPDPCRRSGPCRHDCRPCRRSGPCRRWRRRTCLRRRRRSTVDMAAPARNRVAAAAAIAAPDLEVIFMGISLRKCEGAPPASRMISARPAAPSDSYGFKTALVTPLAELLFADGSKPQAEGPWHPQ